MNELEFSSIKAKIKEREIKNAQAKGQITSIEEMWKSKYECSSLEEAEKKLREIKEENEKKFAKRNEYFEKLEKLVDWESV